MAEWRNGQTGGPANMKDKGLDRNDFKYGIEIIVRGYAAKDGTRRAAGWIVTFPDRVAASPKRETTFTLGR